MKTHTEVTLYKIIIRPRLIATILTFSLHVNSRYHERKIQEAKNECWRAPWYRKWVCIGTGFRIIYHGVIIGGLWIGWAVATGVLKLADLFLEGVKFAIKVLHFIFLMTYWYSTAANFLLSTIILINHHYLIMLNRHHHLFIIFNQKANICKRVFQWDLTLTFIIIIIINVIIIVEFYDLSDVFYCYCYCYYHYYYHHHHHHYYHRHHPQSSSSIILIIVNHHPSPSTS